MKNPVDYSMRLLQNIREEAVDPDYRSAKGKYQSSPVLVALILLLAGVMLAISIKHNSVRSEAIGNEHRELISRISAAKVNKQELVKGINELETDIDKFKKRVTDTSTANKILSLSPHVDAVALTGPGIVIITDDADHDGKGSRVTDRDLQELVNGLRTAGAEAIAINGHPLTSLTAIRGAGSAITVGYISLVRPYRIEAIGDTRTLPARLTQTSGSAWWNMLQRNYGLKYDLSISQKLVIPATKALSLRYAVVQK